MAAEAAAAPWRQLLAQVHAEIDQGVAAAIHTRRQPLACARGCAACCRTHRDIPVYPLELMGLYQQVLEELPRDQAARLLPQLRGHRERAACPFLLDEACAVHAARPMACRLFNVFDTPCAEGEDAFHSRRGDVLDPPAAVLRRALARMLKHHGVSSARERERQAASGAVHRHAWNLRDIPWENLAARLAADADAGPPRGH